MKAIKRLFLISGFLTLPVAVAQGKDKPQVTIEGLSLGYSSDWIIKLAETTDKVDLLKINFNSPEETFPNSDIFFPDTTGLKMNRVTPPKVDENMEKKPNG
ncbi:MAG TPA: hypothetical protein VHO70_22615 [Chitinispirillaceae bacterium]|nr:hypothetical protein [Chitinispirillaceae bacterium]